ncbi:MAG: hypothetical protein JWL73_1495 [Actinomycetia bacterium]|nr:hypothetical protein [Actinomycetes bacterium]
MSEAGSKPLPPSRPADWWALGGLSAVAAVVAVLVRRWVYPLGSLNEDEQMYVFSSRLLAQGHVTLPASYAPFRPWASGVRDGRLVLKYAPIWPSVLAAGNVFGATQVGMVATAAAAAALMGLLGREVFGRWREGLIAAAILVFSPLFFLQTGTYLPYAFELTLEIAVLLLVLGALRRWPEDVPPALCVKLRLVGGGALFGVAVFARPYDALLLVLPITIVVAISMRRNVRRLLVASGWTALGAAVPIAALLIYNLTLMGNPFRMAYTITGPNDQLGFGRRGIFRGQSFDFTPSAAWLSFRQSLEQFPGWVFGGFLLVLLALYAVWRYRRRGVAVWVLLAVGASFAVGYSLFWSPYSIISNWPGARTMGPFYHLAVLIPLALFAAAGVGLVMDRSRALGAATLVVLAVVTVSMGGPRIDRNRPITENYKAVQRLVHQAHLAHAIMFVNDRGTVGYANVAPFLENRPDLDQNVIFSIYRGPTILAASERFPDRKLVRMRTELRPGDDLLAPTRFIEPFHVAAGPTVTLRLRLVNTLGKAAVTMTVHVGHTDRKVVIDRHSTKGETYDVAWTFRADAAGDTATTVALPGRSGNIDVEADFKEPGRSPLRYQRQYAYVVKDGDTNIVAPGIGRFLYRFKKSYWLSTDISRTFSDVTTTASTE